MGGVAWGRVLIGGLVAGLAINVGELILNLGITASAMRQAMARLRLEPISGGAIAGLNLLGFARGIALVWLYAAARPRLGPGPLTAAKIGAVGWLFAYAVPGAANLAIGIFPEYPYTVSFAWGLLEWEAAALLGAWLYREVPSAEG
jgi:hypothetical protein